MKPTWSTADSAISIFQGDCLDVLASMPEASLDSCVTDPPYGLEFMGKEWDGPWKYGMSKFGFKDNKFRNVAPGFQSSRNPMCKTCHRHKRGSKSHQKCECASPKFDELEHRLRDMRAFQEWTETWAVEVLRVLKPGAHLLAFGGTRTHHRLMCAIEDAGFEIRDCVMWIYGCLSDDTEILVDGQWEPYHKAIEGSLAMCYDAASDEFSWQPIQELLVYDYDDTAYRIQSDRTDQIVSRNHRCLVERGGTYSFALAEEIAREREARVPILENLQDLLDAISLLDEGAGHQEQDVLADLCSKSRNGAAETEATFSACGSMDSMRRVSQESLETECLASEDFKTDVLKGMQRSSSGQGMGCTRLQGTRRMDGDEPEVIQSENERPEKSSVEGGRYDLSQARELQGRALRSLPGGVCVDGEEGWLRDGTSTHRGATHRPLPDSQGSGPPRRPQALEQSACQPGAICVEQRPQTVRASRYAVADLARITPIHYRGVVWCVRVPTGAFVARRNGKVFVTGNSGFPKSLDVSKAIDKEAGAEREIIGPHRHAHLNKYRSQASTYGTPTNNLDETAACTDAAREWAGWGTALKPAWEPIIVARKPLVGTVARNVQEHGTGGLNIDGCRVPCDEPEVDRDGEPSADSDYGDAGVTDFTAKPGKRRGRPLRVIDPKPEANGAVYAGRREAGHGFDGGSKAAGETTLGRWPANVVHDGSPEVLAGFPESQSAGGNRDETPGGKKWNVLGLSQYADRHKSGEHFGDSGSAARFFYCAKASNDDRGEGNSHPTVKPHDLMRWLVKLVTPPGGTVLDPFAGSGSTLLAAYRLGFNAIGIEREPEYVDIAISRISAELDRTPLFNSSEHA